MRVRASLPATSVGQPASRGPRKGGHGRAAASAAARRAGQSGRFAGTGRPCGVSAASPRPGCCYACASAERQRPETRAWLHWHAEDPRHGARNSSRPQACQWRSPELGRDYLRRSQGERSLSLTPVLRQHTVVRSARDLRTRAPPNIAPAPFAKFGIAGKWRTSVTLFEALRYASFQDDRETARRPHGPRVDRVTTK
jgi:hypothetical protein